MKRTDLIKKELSHTLIQTVKTQPLKNVTVKFLANQCDINRGTFYYHFKDLYDLINWTFEIEVIEPLQIGLLTKPETEWNALTLQSLKAMYCNREFYCQAIRLDGHNSLQNFIREKNWESWNVLLKRYMEEVMFEPDCDDFSINFFIQYTSQAISNMTIEWIQDGMKIPVEIMAKMGDVATRGIYGVIDKQCIKKPKTDRQ